MSDGIDGENALRFAYRGGTSSRSLPQTPKGKASKSCGIWLGRVSESRASMAVRSVSYSDVISCPNPLLLTKSSRMSLLRPGTFVLLQFRLAVPRNGGRWLDK